jgi:ATP-binding cassette, subfamily B, multidrug efflux pump
MVFKWVWNYVRRYRWVMLLGLCIVLVTSAMNMVSPYLSGKIVDRVIYNKEINLLIPFVLTIVIVTVLRAVLRYAFQMCFEYVSQNCIFNIREDIYNNLQKLDFNYFDKTRTGDIMARMTGDVDAVRHFVGWVIYMIVENGLIFIFGLSVMLSINVPFTLILFILTPPVAYFARKLSIDVKPAFSGIRIQFSRLNSVVQENISGNRVVKAFAKEDYEIYKFDRENKRFKERNIRGSKVWGKYLPILDSLSGTFTITMILIGGIWVINGNLTMGELVTFNSLIYTINNPLRMAGWLINDTQRFSASAEKLIELWKADAKIKDKEEALKKDKLNGVIEFNNVSFGYDDEEPVLKDINIKVKPGETVGIIGPTGSGKTTIINLLCRFYDCSGGNIIIDGVNIKDIELNTLRRSIAVAMQDIFLFSDTIEGNIAYGVPHISLEEVRKAAELAGAHDFIEKFPEGYNTIVGERGVGLSGGQRQRIALARALIKDPYILILDDTTSAVDMETEHDIQQSLNKFNKDKTTFIIAHRISSVKNADKILVLDDGKIIEEGNHDTLMNKKGYYYDVYMSQYGNFDEKGKRAVV